MTLKFYYDLMSQPSRALYIFLKTCNIPFEQKFVNLMKLENHSPEFEAVNPFKKVPAIDHNGFKLTESVGILRYLSREYKTPDHWYPIDSKRQARVDEYLEWQHLNTRAFCAGYFRMKYLDPMVTGKPAKPERVNSLKRRMIACLDEIENIWLKDTPYLAGNEISVADLLCACELEETRVGGFDPLEGRQRLTAWMERVVKQTSPHYEEAHKLLNKLVDRVKQMETSKL